MAEVGRDEFGQWGAHSIFRRKVPANLAIAGETVILLADSLRPC